MSFESLATYVPRRIKKATFSDEEFEVETSAGKIKFKWDEVKFVFLGVIEEVISRPDVAPSKLRSMIRQIFFEASEDRESRKPQTKRSVYIDLFLKDVEQILRIDSSSIDYRGLIPEVGYNSEINFRQLVKELAHRFKTDCLDKTFLAFLEDKKSEIRCFSSVYDFQSYCLETIREGFGGEGVIRKS